MTYELQWNFILKAKEIMKVIYCHSILFKTNVETDEKSIIIMTMELNLTLKYNGI